MNGNVETVNGALLNDEAEKIALKMMLLGKESVGKTSFRNCLAGGALPTDHIPTYLDIQFFHMRTNNSVDLVSKIRKNFFYFIFIFRFNYSIYIFSFTKIYLYLELADSAG